MSCGSVHYVMWQYVTVCTMLCGSMSLYHVAMWQYVVWQCANVALCLVQHGIVSTMTVGDLPGHHNFNSKNNGPKHMCQQ